MTKNIFGINIIQDDKLEEWEWHLVYKPKDLICVDWNNIPLYAHCKFCKEDKEIKDWVCVECWERLISDFEDLKNCQVLKFSEI